jgi:hypothetical protein
MVLVCCWVQVFGFLLFPKKLYGEFLDAVTDKIERELILVGATDAETNCRRGFLSALTS